MTRDANAARCSPTPSALTQPCPAPVVGQQPMTVDEQGLGLGLVIVQPVTLMNRLLPHALQSVPSGQTAVENTSLSPVLRGMAQGPDHTHLHTHSTITHRHFVHAHLCTFVHTSKGSDISLCKLPQLLFSNHTEGQSVCQSAETSGVVCFQ